MCEMDIKKLALMDLDRKLHLLQLSMAVTAGNEVYKN